MTADSQEQEGLTDLSGRIFHLLSKINSAADIEEYPGLSPEIRNVNIMVVVLIKDDACGERFAYLNSSGSQCDLAAMKLVRMSQDLTPFPACFVNLPARHHSI